MSQNFGAKVYAVADIIENVTRHATRNTDTYPVQQTVNNAMHRFGDIINDSFVVVVNEAWEDYNPAYEFDFFLERLYGIPDKVSCSFRWPGESRTITGGANADEIADELGIELPEWEDES